MPVFRYKAIDVDAAALSGTVVADTPRAARDDLRERGLTVARIHPASRRDGAAWWPPGRGRTRRREVGAFVRELATLLAAGIPLLSALDALLEQHKGRFKAAVEGLKDEVAGGASLADAMGSLPRWFDDLDVSIVRVGEETGTLETALEQLAAFKEKARRLRGRAVTALVYPALVSAIGAAVTVFLMTYVVPQLLSTLAETGRPLPGVTRLVKGASDFLLGWWWAVLAAAVGGAAAYKALARTPRGRWAVDRLVLALPLVGDLVRKEHTSRLAVVMATLLQAGLRFDEAIRITRRTLRNRVFRRAMDAYERAVTAGRDVAAPLAESGVFSPLVVQMLAVGQRSGELESMLERLAETYDLEVSTATQRLTAVLEPVVIVVLAVVVGFIAFATILPILEVSHVV